MTGERKKILFIVNPISGLGKQKGLEQLVDQRLDKERYDYQISYTERQGHATEIAAKASAEGIHFVIAVGGDGTVNETAAGLVGTDTVLGIIPTGSGNGLSRHLKIPMNLKRALEVINRGEIRKIDTATINDLVFVNVAGIGFDASVAKKFAASGKRGFASYLKITTGSYKDYQPRKYTLIIDGKTIKRRALLVSFANSSQFGNNTSIDPKASVVDGYIDVCIVGKVPYWKTIFLAPLLFMKRFDHTRYVEIIRAREVQVKRKKGKGAHLDGDPIKIGKDFTMKIHPLSLNVLVP